MATGIPVVAARAAGSESIVQDGTTGLLVRPGAIEGYANALARLATDTGFRAQMGQAGIAEAANYEWDRINSAVAETYLRVLRNRRKRR